MQDPESYASLSVGEQEGLIDLITSVRGSLRCSQDVEQAIVQKLGIAPPDAHVILEHLINKGGSRQEPLQGRT